MGIYIGITGVTYQETIYKTIIDNYYTGHN